MGRGIAIASFIKQPPPFFFACPINISIVDVRHISAYLVEYPTVIVDFNYYFF